jgi:hypothetical protein
MEKALIDRGANGGICGDDMTVLGESERFVDVFGLAGQGQPGLDCYGSSAYFHT